MAFENHGSDVGATLPHLHGQLYAYGHLPPVTATKLASHEHHRRAHGDCLGCRLIAEDLDSERVIHANEHFVAAIPFASGGRSRSTSAPGTTAPAGSATSRTTPPSTSCGRCPTSSAATTACGASRCRT